MQVVIAEEGAVTHMGVAILSPVNQTPILEYIKNTWADLTRYHRDLASAAADPKYPAPENGRWPVFVGPHEDIRCVQDQLSVQMGADFAKIDLRVLPEDVGHMTGEGLLYLPKPYVVPGGRFNEMYGWDSFFIVIGLLRDGEVDPAKGMVDNFLYEIAQYGKILNANRTYYLTRSQPPFLTPMILRVFQQTQDRKWLADTVPAIEQYYRYWTTEPHLTPDTGLSRYYDSGEGPAPEVVSSEVDSKGRTDYDLILRYYRSHRIEDYDVGLFYDSEKDQLTDAFYKGDRSMRESGFDPSNRFGPFSVDIIHYNPVCLNSLLCLMETQTAEIMDILGRLDAAEMWRARARDRAAKINSLMWDAEQGLYFDYHFPEARVRKYPFLATYYPLWAGIADPQQAAQLVRNLTLFERIGGLQTSTRQTGDQWDAPFGWAPLQWIAVEGLRRYGFQAEADRISERFLAMVKHEYDRTGSLVEKYDVVHARSEVGEGILFGYTTNEAGFGWTNAVFSSLLDSLPEGARELVMEGRKK